ncbi:MAG: protein NO VEIN domain-containing protein [Pseudanabaena sp.]
MLATFGIMSVMLFIWCFDSTLAPYTMNSFFSRFSKLSEVLRGETQEVKSLIGDISFHADKRTGKTNNIFVNNLDRYTNRFVLAHLNPSEYNREELSNLLKESARLLIQSVYQVSNVNESIDKVWGSLIKSEQLDVAVARNVILESADSIIKFLSVHNRHEGIKRIILDLNESISKREEYRTYNRDYQNIDLEIYSLKQQLGKILEDNSRENTASSIVLQAVRDKIKQFGYKLTNIPFEIFQNADDALVELEMMAQGHPLSSDRFRFIIEIEDNTITMMHWGRPINCFVHPDYPLHDYRENGFGQDLEKMLSFNYSDKRNDDHNVTGKFGLGFKSVHLICKEPLVFSNRIAFRIVGGLLPSPLLGNSNSTIQTPRDRLEQKLQRQNQNIFDGTAIFLSIDPNLSISIDDTVREFERLVGLLLIFAKKITQFKYVKGNNQYLTIWNPANLLTSSSIQIGEVMIGDFRTNALCLTLGNGKFVITLDKKDAELRASLPNDIANIWVTAPTQEKFGLKFIINASFDINTGRSEVLTNQKNDELSNKLGFELGEQLCKLFALTQNNWNEFIETLQITGTTQYEFWKLIWNELALKSLDKQSKLIRVMMLGNKGMGYFLSNCPALPNGLWGEYQQLVLPSEIVYIVENILKDQRFFNHVFQWERVKNRCNPSTIIDGNEWDKYKKIIACSPIHQQFKVEDIDLLQVIKWQLLEKHQADVQTANQVGQLINKACLEEIKQYGLVEYQKLFDWLNKVEFLSQSNNYQLNFRLLDVNSGDDDEKLLSAFAPDEYVLNQQYGNTGKDFFYACRTSKLGRAEERLIEWEERLIEWILAITADSKRLAAIRYLEYLRIVDDSLFSRLLSRLKEVDWLQELFPPDQDTDVTRETDEVDASLDKRGQDGTGNPKWGDPGEALAKLFYDHIYLANYSYNLVRKGGYNCNHDFLLCVDGREIEIEVKTIASKSFRLSISEWKELVSKNDCYELLIVEHSGSDVSKVIRIQNAWDTLQNALAKLDSENLTAETILSKNIESLIGLQQDNLQKGNPKNVVVVNWDRLVNIYGQGSNDENITFYSCNAQLVYGQRSVNTTNPVFTQIT